MYQRYQNLWHDYVRHKKIKDEFNDVGLTAFFKSIKSKYAASTLWVIYSCINSYMIDTYGCTMKSLARLNKYLKTETSDYVVKKSKTFSAEQIHEVIRQCMCSTNDPKKTLIGICIAIMYYGLLRMNEAYLIQVEDVRIVGERDDKKIQVTFDHKRKRKNEGFTYYVPSVYLPLFQRYMTELQTKNVKTKCFLRNWNVKARKRIQKSGENLVKNLHKDACKMLNISSKKYTTHCWRRSAATNLADRGVSFINLKRHGQWKSDSVVEGYIANSEPIRRERETCLLPANLEPTNMFVTETPNDLETFVDLNGFSQIYDEDLDTNNIHQPIVVFSQENNEVQVPQTDKVSDVGTKEKDGKMKPSDVFGNGNSFQNCSFVFHM